MKIQQSKQAKPITSNALAKDR